MTEIDPDIVINKLVFLDKYLKKLADFEDFNLSEYLKDFNQQLVVERLLQLTIQVALDINRYLLKQLEIEQPESNFATFIEVGNCGIITPELAKVLAPSGSLRNRLVHLYEEIDPMRVHTDINIALQYYPIYQRQVTIYLDSLE
ncbi:MAG: DUF86 domain-containing protein [Hormoscilla sp.]